MKITLISKLNIFTLSVVCFSGIFAQNKKVKLIDNFDVERDVVINLSTSHTAVVFETWNRNTVAVEAFIEGENLTEENSERLLYNWQVEALGNNREITINAVTGNFWSERVTPAANIYNSNMPEFRTLVPMIADMLGPILENIENNPMPSALTENLASMNFDTHKFKENEEKYVQQWGNQIKEKFGDNSENVINNWTKELSRNTKQIQAVTQNWAGERFAQRMQTWASQFSGEFSGNVEIVQRDGTNVTVYRYHSNVVNPGEINRIIKISMPEEAMLKLNIRHGDVKLAEKTNNMVASLTHTNLDANVIEGKGTYIRASYSPIAIQQWNNGQLVINYVKNCRIRKAQNLRLNVDSSNAFVQELGGDTAISGSFGAITVVNLLESFSNLDLVVENSDFKLKLPKSAFNFTYNGAQSRISLPKALEVKARRNFGNVFVNGFQNTRNTDKMITMSAKYSDIILQ